MGAIGLDRDRTNGWDIARPAGVAPLGGASVIGFRDCGAAGLDMRVVAIPAVTVVIEFGGNELTSLRPIWPGSSSVVRTDFR